MAADAPSDALQQWNMSKNLLEGRVSVIVGGLTVIWMRDFPIVAPGAVVALDLGEKQEAFKQVLDQALSSEDLKREMRGVVQSSITHAGHEVMVFKQVRYYPQLSICATFVDNLFLVGLNESLLFKCLDNLGGDGGGTLAGLPSFQRSRSKAEASPLLEAFLNIEGFTSRVRGLIPDEWLGILHNLGLDSVNSLYYASAVQDGCGLDTMYFDAPQPRRGLLNLSTRNVSEKTLKFIPKSAGFFEVFSINLGQAWDLVWNTMTRVIPPREFKYVKRDLDRAEQEIGFRIRDGLLAALGEEWAFYAEMRRNAAIPNMVGCVEIKDRDRANKVLGSLLGLGDVETRDVPFGDHTLTVINLPDDDVPFAPSYSFVGDRLIMSLTPAGLKSALRRLSRPHDSVLDNPDFQDTFKKLDWKKAVMLRFLDTRRLAAFGYNMAENFLPGLLSGMDIPLDLAMLPSEEVILDHLNGWGDMSYCDQDGIVYKGRYMNISSLLAVVGRFLDKAPGVPPMVLGRLFERYTGQAYGKRGGPSRKTSVVPQIEERPRADIVNPLKAGDPQEATQRIIVKKLTQEIAEDPENGSLYFQRGHSYHRLRDFAASVADFKRAHTLGFQKQTSAYNIACSLSLQGKKDEAFKWLEVSITAGYQNWGVILNDSDLDNLRKDPRYEALINRYRSQ